MMLKLADFSVVHISLPLVLLCLVAACNTVPGPKYQDAERRALQGDERIAQLEAEIGQLDERIQDLKTQAQALSGYDEQARRDQLVVPVRIAFERMSGGYDDDGTPGDDGLMLYIQPIDRDGHVIKAAGTLDVRLFDLSNPPNAIEITRYHFDPENARKLWYGRLMTNHFTVKCPWPPDGPPKHKTVTARAVFTDLLTGESFEAQQAFDVALPSADRSAAAR
jgi:hypothetical protein